ncbi:serine/threonine protein kinase [archaeon CG06_land_8_20_14_3_00_37_11]|nr:MAG: serine/threonine protein kinase [archaeon CG06_land_8_20_14_3_00_37_11]
MTREDFKVYNEVFDKSTIRVLDKFRHEYYEAIENCVSTGKEANVFRAVTKKGYVAVKIFRTYTSSFDNMQKYITGDPRFARVKKKKHDLIYQWCRKEFRNLNKAYNLGVHVPKPFAFLKNVIIMEFIGDNGVAAPLLKDVVLEKPEEWYKIIINNMVKLYKGGLVHADLSEFNILVHKNRPIFIDMAQSVLIEHPKAGEFLRKDFENINNYFRKKCRVIGWDSFRGELNI